MLKIKDSVDLTELSKFGFVNDGDEWYFDFKPYLEHIDYSYLLVSPTKEINVEYVEMEHIGTMVEKIYGLIQAGLVEKRETV